MISTELLAHVIGVELLAILVVFTAVFTNAFVSAAADRKRERELRKGRPLLISAIEGSLDARGLTYLANRGIRVKIQMLSEIAPALQGESREALRKLATRIGVTRYATKNCRSRLWWRRLYATRVFTLIDGGDKIMPVLLKDTHPLVRAQVTEWAASHPAPDTLRALVDLLDDKKRIERFTVQDTLLRIGRPMVPLLVARLGKMGPRGILSGLQVASRISDPTLLPLAVEFSKDKRTDIRAAATDVLAASGGPDAVEFLYQALADSAGEVREAAARGLGKMSHWPSAGHLLPLLGDSTWQVRKAAAVALVAMGAPGALILRTAQKSSDRFAADAATQALGEDAE